MQNEFCVIFDLVEDWFFQDRKRHLMVDEKSKATFLEVLETFYTSGPSIAREKLPRTRTKPLFDGIWEIRVGQFRLAYFWDGSACVLLHGIKKKQNKWTAKDKEHCKKNKKEYVTRQNNR